jgi:hypothetical protein
MRRLPDACATVIFTLVALGQIKLAVAIGIPETLAATFLAIRQL